MSKDSPFHLDDHSAAIKELQTYPHWVGYRKEERNGSITKVPYSPHTGRHAQSNVPATWSDYPTAEAAVRQYGFDGLGYMFQQDFTGVDLDHCIDDAGAIEPWALKVIRFLDSYTEFSPSGTGVHVLVRGRIPRGIRRFIPPRSKPLHKRAAIEMYCKKRYFTVTGKHVPGTPAELKSNQGQLDKLFQQVTLDEMFAPPKKSPEAASNPESLSTQATPTLSANEQTSPPTAINSSATTLQQQDLSDEVLLRRACEASNGERFHKLYYQGGHDGYSSPSEADMALCLHLAFWTGRDANRMDQLFRQSVLYREKWNSRRSETTYGWETIQRAILHCSEVYTPPLRKVEIVERIESLLTLTSNADELIEGVCSLELQDVNEEKRWYCQPNKVSLHEVLACLRENELGDAQLFTEAFHKRVCFDFVENDWYIWRDHIWQHDLAGRTLLLVSAIADIYNKAADILSGQQDALIMQQIGQIKTEHGLIGQEHVSSLKVNVQQITTQIEQLRKRATSLYSYRRMRNIITMAAPLMGVHSSIWDQKPLLLPTPNGVLNLETGTCDEGKPGDHLRTSCPTTWTGLDTPCPRWERFLQEIFADKPERADIISFLQRLLGYGITGSTKDHIFCMFYGADGRNGKDTLLGIFHDVMGRLADVVPNDIFLASDFQRSSGAATPHLSILHGMRSAWGSEPNVGDRIDIGQIKQLTGGGTISTRSLYAKSFYSFIPTHKLFMMTNHKLAISAAEGAAWDRLCLIDFGMRFLDDPDPNKDNERPRDRTLVESLKQERSGILAWLVRGCLDWQQQGLNIPPVIKKSTRDYREEEDMLKCFIEDRCHCSPEASVNATRLYNAYKLWHSENLHGLCMTSNQFGREMIKRFKRVHSRAGNCYNSIGLGYRSDQPTLPAEEIEMCEACEGLNGLQNSSLKKNNEINNKSKFENPQNASHASHEIPREPEQIALDFIDACAIPPDDDCQYGDAEILSGDDYQYDDADIPTNDAFYYDDADIPAEDPSVFSSDISPETSTPQKDPVPIEVETIDEGTTVEQQLPAFLIPSYYCANDLDIQHEETYALENILKLKKHIQCKNCREQWEDIVKHNELAQAHQGLWWCDRCSNRYKLMQKAHAKGYPALRLRHFDIDAGCASWLIFVRSEHEKRIQYILDIL